MLKGEKVFAYVIAFVIVVWLIVITFKSINTEKVKTPYGIAFKLSYNNGTKEFKEIEFYTFENEFIYFYEKGGFEPTLVVAKNKIDAIYTLPKPKK